MKRRIFIIVSTFFLMLVLTAQFAFADSYRRGRTYEVTITNITRDQVFSPPVVISHKWGFRLFELGAQFKQPKAPFVADDHRRTEDLIPGDVGDGDFICSSSTVAVGKCKLGRQYQHQEKSRYNDKDPSFHD